MVKSHWMSAVLGLHYLKQGLECFCDDVVHKQHERIIESVRAICPQADACTQCNIETLIPAHVHVENRCPLGQVNCNCKEVNKQGRDFRECPKGICGIIYDEIIKTHGSTPPSPNWKNTDVKKWFTDPWAIATCFIKTKGYAGRKCAGEFDCSGLLSVIIYNKAFLDSLDCGINTDNAFTKAVEIRNMLFHSSTYNIEEKVAHEYINVMIDALNLLVSYEDKSKHVAIRKLAALKERGSFNTLNVEVENDKKAMEYLINANSEQLKEMGSSNKDTDKEMAEKAIPEEIESDKNEEWRNIKILISVLPDVVFANKIEEGNTISDIKDAQKKGDIERARSLLKKSYDRLLSPAPSKTQYEMPTINRPYDGRLITLNKKQVGGLLANCDDKDFIPGGFGQVYISKDKVPGLDIRVVIKKIVPDGEGPSMKMLSASNEKIASRVMHFAIVPLIAYMEESLEENKRAFYFISPFLEKKTLREVISKDLETGEIQLKQYKRIEILFQIASALDHLHTPVQNSRGIIVHKDLTTMNIVLDDAFNARIIDFGLAREMNDGKSKQTKTTSKCYGTDGYHQTIKYSSLTVHEDYYNFGIVIRELLTGRQPYIVKGRAEVSELRKHQDYRIKRMIQVDVWTHHTDALVTLSTECLNSRDKNLRSASIVERLKIMHTHKGQSTSREEVKCKICMVNLAVSDGHSPPHRCNQMYAKMKVCVSCMRNSHINPIKCPQCNECVEPEIGHTFAALLIAGNDKNAKLAKSFKEDVEEIKKVLVSKSPCVIGIRDKNVMTVTPSDPGTPEKLLPRLMKAIYMLKFRKGLGTLLLYFTGHHSDKTGFELGDRKELLTLGKLQQYLKKVAVAWGKQENTNKNKKGCIARILVFLDCCKPPNVAGSIPALSTDNIKIIQVNACRSDESFQQPLTGSPFQKFFIQALTRRSYDKQCHNDNEGYDKSEKGCKDCKISDKNFITVQQLLEYISKHMKKSLNGKQPLMYMNGITWLDACVGYNVDFVFNLDVKFEGQNQTEDVHLSPKIFQDITDLKKSILEKIAHGDEKSNAKLTPPDTVALQVHTGSQGGRELRTIEDVYLAVIGKREIVATYRSMVSNILNGRVVQFIPTKVFCQNLDKNLVKDTEEGKKIATLSWLDLHRITEEIKGNCDLKNIYDVLDEVDEMWRKDTKPKELKIIFPCINGDKFHDFMVLDLQEFPGTHLQQLLSKIAGIVKKRQMSFISSVTVLLISAVLMKDNAPSQQQATVNPMRRSPSPGSEPSYAKPQKSRNISQSSSANSSLQSSSNTGNVSSSSAQGGHLESMLGDLQSDLNKQGVSIKTKGLCAACNQPVFGQVITALGKIWHIEHFNCAQCHETLGTKNFYERDGMAYCERDYHSLFAPRCGYCNGPIVDKCVTALNNTWHPEHFFCAQCGRPFGDEGFHEKNGKAYCRADFFEMFAPKCGGCGRAIVDNYISALNRHWHPECFACWECHQPFGGSSFFDYEGLPYCETHYHLKRGSLCAGCHKPIAGRCITAMYKKFHPEHFVCAFCLKQLNKGTFKEQHDRPYCHPCFVKLFG